MIIRFSYFAHNGASNAGRECLSRRENHPSSISGSLQQLEFESEMLDTRRPMRALHPIALALVGWYLLLPPTSPDFPMGNVDAPLSEWLKRPTTYRDKAECEHVLDKQRRLKNAKNRQIAVRYYK